MEYPPKHYISDTHELLAATVRAYPLACLVSSVDSEPLITHLPLVYYPSDAGDDYFIGHFDARNPQAKSIGQPLSVVFSGPSLYISPSDYQKQKGRLPTYNFIRVHLTGDSEPITDPERVMQSLVELTDYLEGTDHNWQLSSDNLVAQKLLPYIKAFRFKPQNWIGRFKLSQDKPIEERQRTFAKLKSLHQEPFPGYWDMLSKELFE
ncbi:MAG: FMN-binding negative transcriptional regulator [Bacteroidota bacterium]